MKKHIAADGTVILLKDDGTLAKPGGAVKGKAVKNTSRDLGQMFLTRYIADFRKHGIATIERVRNEAPVEYMKIAVKLLPKDVNLHIEHSFSDVLMEAHRQIDYIKKQEIFEAEIVPMMAEDGK